MEASDRHRDEIPDPPDVAGRSSDVSLAAILDDICGVILRATDRGVPLRQLRVHPAVYAAVAANRPDEVARGHPLMLLGLEVVSRADVARDHVEIA